MIVNFNYGVDTLNTNDISKIKEIIKKFNWCTKSEDFVKSEGHLQQLIYLWFHDEFKQYRGLLYHNYNNPRSIIQGAKLIGLGLVKGNPDLTLAISNGIYSAMYIELKFGNEKPKIDQIIQIDRLQKAGNYVCMCNNFDDAKEEIISYLHV